MSTDLRIGERRALSTAQKASRDKDAAQAILDYKARRLAILAKTARLRETRLAKTTEGSKKDQSTERPSGVGPTELWGNAKGKARKGLMAKADKTSA